MVDFPLPVPPMIAVVFPFSQEKDRSERVFSSASANRKETWSNRKISGPAPMVESEDFRTCAATGLPRSVFDLRRMVQHRADPAHTGHGSWHQQDHHLGHHHIEKNPDGVLGDSSNVAHLHGAGSNLIAAKIQDGNDRQINNHRSQTVQACEQTIGLDGGDGVVFERFPHPFYFMGLFAERPDHPHAGQIFPQDSGAVQKCGRPSG